MDVKCAIIGDNTVFRCSFRDSAGQIRVFLGKITMTTRLDTAFLQIDRKKDRVRDERQREKEAER